MSRASSIRTRNGFASEISSGSRAWPISSSRWTRRRTSTPSGNWWRRCAGRKPSTALTKSWPCASIARSTSVRRRSAEPQLYRASMSRTIAFGAPMIGAEERAAVADVLAGPILVHGPRAVKFEEDCAAYTATAHAVELTGARAVFVEVERDTGNIDIAAFEAAITPRTKAVAPVHFLG